MKRLGTIFILSVYMFSFIEFHNLLKIPVLIEHFKEHQQLDAEISFWSFIKLHYFDPIVVDDDYQRDQQLPFRNTDCCLIAAASASECLPIAVEICPPAEQAREFHEYDDNNKPQFTSFDIFQPPRCA